MKYFLLLLFIGIAMFGCVQEKTERKTIEFKHIKDITYDLPEGENLAYGVFPRKSDSVEILTVFYRGNNNLINYNLNTGKIIDTIKVEYQKKRLFSFFCINDDSIILRLNPSSDPFFFHDSTLLLIDKTGKTKQAYSFKGVPVPASYNPELKQSEYQYSSSFFQGLDYHKGKVFLPLINRSEEFARLLDTTFRSIGGHMDLQKNKFISHKLKAYRLPDKPSFYSKQTRIYLCTTPDGNILYSYPFSSQFYEYNPNTEKYSTHKLKSVFIDTIFPEAENRDNIMQGLAAYGHIYYNPYRHEYYRIANIAAPAKSSPEEQKRRRHSIIIADENFKVLAEEVLSEDLSSMMPFFTENGVFFFNSAKWKETGQPVYSQYEINITDKVLKPEDYAFKPKISENKVERKEEPLSYIRTLNINKGKYAVILIPVSNSCPACVQDVCKLFSENPSLFTDKNIYLVLSGKNKSGIQSFLNKNHISPESENLIIDYHEVFLNHIYSFVNPRLFCVENDVLTSDKIYNVPEMYGLEPDLKSLFQTK